MNIVIGLVEGSWVNAALGIMSLFIGAIGLYVKLKTKSDKTDIMDAVREEVKPLKKDIIELQRDKAVMNNTLQTLVSAIASNHAEIKDIMRERDKSYKENFLLLFNKIDTKQDKN